MTDRLFYAAAFVAAVLTIAFAAAGLSIYLSTPSVDAAPVVCR